MCNLSHGPRSPRATPCLSCGVHCAMTRPRDEDGGGGCLRQHRLHCSGNEPDVSLLPSPATHTRQPVGKGRALSRTLAAREILSSLLFATRLDDVSLPHIVRRSHSLWQNFPLITSSIF